VSLTKANTQTLNPFRPCVLPLGQLLIRTFCTPTGHKSVDEWWRMTGSNRRPPACKAGALPAELIPHWMTLDDSCPRMNPGLNKRVVGLVGLEPTTPALSRRCSNQLSYRPEPVTRDPQTLSSPQAAGDIPSTTDKCEHLRRRVLNFPERR
jgi:hypothetical protein